jgi:hypothetical protein
LHQRETVIRPPQRIEKYRGNRVQGASYDKMKTNKAMHDAVTARKKKELHVRREMLKAV